MTEPRTAAGRNFLDGLIEEWEGEYGEDRPEATAKRRAADAKSITAIEDEAAALPCRHCGDYEHIRESARKRDAA